MREKGFKRKLVQLRRVASTGFQNLFRNAWLTTAAIAVMVVTLTVVVIGIIGYLSLNDTVDTLAKNITVSVYLEDEITEEQQNSLLSALENNEYVESVYYKSKEEALQDFQDRYAEQPEILSGVSITGNILPASFEITLIDLDQYDNIVLLAEGDEYSSFVSGTKNNETKRSSVQGFTSAQKFITRASIVASVVFGTISVLIIFNTIRMAIFTRHDEIEIMKLIGATPRYIKGPFIFEAMFYGLIAAIISFAIVFSGLLSMGSSLTSDIEIQATIDNFINNWLLVFFGLIVLGVGIGFISSSIALAKYLRLKKW